MHQGSAENFPFLFLVVVSSINADVGLSVGSHYAFFSLWSKCSLDNWCINLSNVAEQILMTCLSIIDGLINQLID